MPRLVPLPHPLADRPFSIGDASAHGIGEGRLASRDLIIPFPAVRDAADAEVTYARMCARFAARMKPWQFFSHETALALLGAPMPLWPYRPGIHVSAHRPAREPRVRGVIGHRLQVRDDAHGLVDGLRIEDPVRAWCQTGRLWAHRDLVAAGYFLVTASLATGEELAAECGYARALPLVRKLRRAAQDVRVGAESSEESRLRLVLVAAGLPEPELNIDLVDDAGRFIARLDLMYRAYRVGVEYDGRQHATDTTQFERDADRWAAIRRLGWEHVRILRHHLRGDGQQAVRLVREALIRAGWPG